MNLKVVTGKNFIESQLEIEHLTVLKLSVNFSTSNLGLCPHSGEHEYELVKFQVFSQELFHHFGTFTSSHV